FSRDWSSDVCSSDLGLQFAAANSAALVAIPEARLDWARPGIMLYGCSPFAHRSAAEIGLKPVMSLQSALIAVRDLKDGDFVGYRSEERRVGKEGGTG